MGRCVAPFGAGRVPAPPGGFGADLARCSTAVEEAYSPIVNGQRMARNVYAKAEAECEEKLATLIQEMKTEITAEKTG